MAQDCYALFKTIYNQAVADGLGTAVATAAAQVAMADCLSQQSLQVPAAAPFVEVSGGIASDDGPSGNDRGNGLGTKDYQRKKA